MVCKHCSTLHQVAGNTFKFLWIHKIIFSKSSSECFKYNLSVKGLCLISDNIVWEFKFFKTASKKLSFKKRLCQCFSLCENYEPQSLLVLYEIIVMKIKARVSAKYRHKKKTFCMKQWQMNCWTSSFNETQAFFWEASSAQSTLFQRLRCCEDICQGFIQSFLYCVDDDQSLLKMILDVSFYQFNQSSQVYCEEWKSPSLLTGIPLMPSTQVLMSEAFSFYLNPQPLQMRSHGLQS